MYYFSSFFSTGASFTGTFSTGAFFTGASVLATGAFLVTITLFSQLTFGLLSIFFILPPVGALTFTHTNSDLITFAINSVDFTEFVLAGIKLSTTVSSPFVFIIANDFNFSELASLTACFS
jgi:hypothetical protein